MNIQTGGLLIGSVEVLSATRNLTVGDGHTIGDDGDDNLEISSSSGENIVVKSTDGIYLRSGGNNNALVLNSSQNATFSGTITATAGIYANSLKGLTSTGFTQGSAGDRLLGTFNCAQAGQTLNLVYNGGQGYNAANSSERKGSCIY